EDVARKLRIRHLVGADLLRGLTQLLEIGVARKAKVEFYRGPVAAVIGDLAQVAERDDLQLAIGIAQPDRAQGEALDCSLGLAAMDDFTDPERIVGQVED